MGISKDGKSIVYKVATPSVADNKSNSKFYTIPVNGGNPVEVKETKDLLVDKNVSPNGLYILSNQEVKTENVLGKDIYSDLSKADAQVYNGLDYRHWDTWNNGSHNHVFYAENKDKAQAIDIMSNEPYDSPQKPFGGDEDFIWSPDSKSIIYVCKKKAGTAYAISTNTDLYEYHLETKTTKNLTENNPGYDTNPVFSPTGNLTWLQMKRDGYEADKNDIIVRFKGIDMNLTANWDGSVDNFLWSTDGKKVYFTAAVDGAKHLFEVNFPGLTKIAVTVKQITSGDFDVNDLVGFSGDNIIVTRTDSLGAGLTKQIAYSKEPGDLGDRYNSFLDCEEVDGAGNPGDVLITRDGKLMRPKRLPSNLYQFRPGTGEDRCVLDCITSLQNGADLLWIETEKPHVGQIAAMVDEIRKTIPNAKLVYNNSPSFNWTLNFRQQVYDAFVAEGKDVSAYDRAKLMSIDYDATELAQVADEKIRTFQRDGSAHAGIFHHLITLPTYHTAALSTDNLAKGYFADQGMLAYVKGVQRQEIRQGIACVKHQNMSGSDIGDAHKEYFAGEAALKAGGKDNTMNQFS